MQCVWFYVETSTASPICVPEQAAATTALKQKKLQATIKASCGAFAVFSIILAVIITFIAVLLLLTIIVIVKKSTWMQLRRRLIGREEGGRGAHLLEGHCLANL